MIYPTPIVLVLIGVLLSSSIVFYYTFQRANIYNVPVIKDNLFLIFSFLFTVALIYTFLCLLTCKYFKIKTGTDMFIIALIFGGLPSLITTYAQLGISYLEKTTNSNGSFLNDVKLALLRAIVKCLGEFKDEKEKYLIWISIYSRLIEETHKKRRMLSLEIQSDKNRLSLLNKVFEWVKHNETILKIEKLIEEGIVKITNPSKKIHILLNWYKWDGFHSLLQAEVIQASFSKWDGVERRKEFTKGPDRFYESKA